MLARSCWLQCAWITASIRGVSAQDLGVRNENVVVTDCGPVAGAVDTRWGGLAFRGIPFAMPPIGDRRWKRSELLKDGGGCWVGTLDTRERSDDYMDQRKCLQPSWSQADSWEGVEDCLTVDVRTPINSDDILLPVLVDIHGGSLMVGQPDVPYALRSESLVLVGVRYRLNVLGFLALAELTAHDPRAASGNYGFSDQVTALQWVRRNARGFGGDANQVTIIGCSSGGSSVWNLMAIPSARGLFARAIPLSAASRNNVSLAQAEIQNRGFVRGLCANDTIASRYHCLMNLNHKQIEHGFSLIAGNNFPYFEHPSDFELPSAGEYSAGVCIIDGVIVEEPLQIALQKASSPPVSILSGSCSQEGDTNWLTLESTAEDFKLVVEGFVANLTSASWPPQAVRRVLDLYPPTSREFFGIPKAAMDAMVADIRVVCGTIFNARRVVEGRASGSAFVNAWLYYADMHSTNDEVEMTHCKTLGVLSAADCADCSPDSRAFHKNLVRITSSFIQMGSLPEEALKRFSDTPSFDQGNYILNTIGQNITSHQSRLRERCEFWRDAKVLEQYAWDELRDALSAAVIVV